MGFIGYRRQQTADAAEIVRIYLECQDKSSAERGEGSSSSEISFSYAVDVVFPGGESPCRLRGVDGVLVLKKFYKLVFSLEERAREHGNDWRAVLESPGKLLESLRYTRNARDLTGTAEPLLTRTEGQTGEQECAPISKGL